jgi:hypothetical protein
MLTLRRLIVGFLLLSVTVCVAPVMANGARPTQLNASIILPSPSIDWMGDAPKPQPGLPGFGIPQSPVVTSSSASVPSLLRFVLDLLLDSWYGYPPRVGIDWMGDAPKPQRPG